MKSSKLKKDGVNFKFTKEAKTLMTISGLFMFGFTLSNVFTNIFIWKLINNLKILSYYNITCYFGLLLFFPIGSYIGKKRNLGFVLKAGLITHIIFYLAIIALGKSAKDYLYWLGIMYGLGQAFYYVAMNQLTIQVTVPENRSKYLGLSGIINSIAVIVPPIISGYLITAFRGIVGYDIMFGITLVIFIIAGILAARFSNESKFKNFEFFYSITKYRKEWFMLNVAHFIVGIRDGVSMFLINVLVYNIMKSESDVGMFSAVSAFIVTATYFITVKFMKKENTLKFMRNINMFMVIAPLCLFLFKNKIGVYGYSIFNSLATPALAIALTSLAFAMIEELSKKYRQVEYLAVREVYSNSGRIVGIFLFTLFSNKIDSNAVYIFLIGINFCYMVAYYIYSSIYKQMNANIIHKHMKRLRFPIRQANAKV